MDNDVIDQIVASIEHNIEDQVFRIAGVNITPAQEAAIHETLDFAKRYVTSRVRF